MNKKEFYKPDPDELQIPITAEGLIKCLDAEDLMELHWKQLSDSIFTLQSRKPTTYRLTMKWAITNGPRRIIINLHGHTLFDGMVRNKHEMKQLMWMLSISKPFEKKEETK